VRLRPWGGGGKALVDAHSHSVWWARADRIAIADCLVGIVEETQGRPRIHINGVEFNEIHDFFGRASEREIPRALVAYTPVPESAGSPLSSYPAT
jgi:hypothetical protein